jgi:hypothetical protein
MAHQGFINKPQTRLLYVRPALIVYPVVSFRFEKFENGASGFRKQAANTTLIFQASTHCLHRSKLCVRVSAFRKHVANLTLIS